LDNLVLKIINVDLETLISSTMDTNVPMENALKSILALPTLMTIVTPTLIVPTTPKKASDVKMVFARELLLDLHVTITLNVFTVLSVTLLSTNAKLTSLLEHLAHSWVHLPMKYAVSIWSVVEPKLVSSTIPLQVEPNVTLETNVLLDSPAITELADLLSLLYPAPTPPPAKTLTLDTSLAIAANAHTTNLKIPLASGTTFLSSTALPPINAVEPAEHKLDLA
jgi:hypothetical protein